MQERYRLPGPNLWTREMAYPHREEVWRRLERLIAGDTLVIDCQTVEVFDYSFPAELFGRTVLAMSGQFPDRFFAVEALTPYARENLVVTLDRLHLMMIELSENSPTLIGETHRLDTETFAAIAASPAGITAADLSSGLAATINAVNERLAKLAASGVVRREQAISEAGRKQFLYRTLT